MGLYARPNPPLPALSCWWAATPSMPRSPAPSTRRRRSAMTGIGGVGSLVHDAKTGRTENINFLGVAPAAAREDMWEDAIEGETADAFGFILRKRVNALGHQAPMVPGNLKGYDTLLRDYGTMSWSEVTPWAIAHADGGWVVRPHVYSYAMQDEEAQGRVHNAEIVGYTSEGRTLYRSMVGSGSRATDPQSAAWLCTQNHRVGRCRRLLQRRYRQPSPQTCKRMAVLSPRKTRQLRRGSRARLGGYRGLRLATDRPVDRAFKYLRH